MSKKSLLRLLMLIGAVAAIVVCLPRNDRKSFAYEQGQPWKYSLLTAPFDIPVYLDSATFQRQTDSITSNFSPYITVSDTVAQAVLTNLALSGVSPQKIGRLRPLVGHVYSVGVISPDLNRHVDNARSHAVRTLDEEENTSYLSDASGMLTAQEACKWIVDGYQGGWSAVDEISADDVEKLRSALHPNVMVDSAVNSKYLNLELQSVNAGQGKIRQGQRIVDKGEIVTPQIYTNLQTYEKMLEANDTTDHYRTLAMLAAQCAYVLVVFLVFYTYLYVYRRRYYDSLRYMSFFMALITLFALLDVLMFEVSTIGVYIIPFAMVPVMTLIFADSRTAIFTLLTVIFISALQATYPFQFIITQIITGFMAVVSLDQLSKRSQLLRTALVVLVSYCVLGVIMLYISSGTLSDVDGRLFMAYAANAVAFSLTYVLLFLIEKIFGFTSAVTLVELSDINSPLLRRLAEEAPGTFQHSMQVSTLAAEAARAIGANTQLVRTGALYHDIGKMRSPVFFTENQHGVNPHDGLDPQTSASRIISHVTDGVAMAEKAKLPRVITDFIREHHGHGLTRYFYNTAANALPDGAPAPDTAPYTYPGPNPRSKETAIMMMADAVEAASRSLKEYTPESIAALVDCIIDGQMAEGMYRNAPLSFADIEKIKETFRRRLSTIYHTRVAYPDRKS